MRFIPQRAGRYGRSVPVSVALAIALCAVLLAGCGKKDKIVGPEPPGSPTYPKLSSPVNVLRALEQAYEARDSVEFKLLYNDTLYKGTSIDQSNPGSPIRYTFYKADEVRHVAALAKNFGITKIDLIYPPVLDRFTDLSDPQGWATIQVLPSSGLRLEINDAYTSTAYSIASDRESFEFKFIPKSPDSSSPTDTTWQIVRWSEVAN